MIDIELFRTVRESIKNDKMQKTKKGELIISKNLLSILVESVIEDYEFMEKHPYEYIHQYISKNKLF